MAGQHGAVHDLTKAGLRERVEPAFHFDHRRRHQPAERTVHVDLRAVDRAEQRGVERPPGHRRRMQDAPVRRCDGVDAAQEQLVERVRKRGPFGEVDERTRALALDDHAGVGEEPDGLLRVRRVALGALRDLPVHAAVRHQRPHERLGRSSIERPKAKLDVFARRRPRRGEVRTVRDHEHRARRREAGREADHRRQRWGIDPLQVVDREDQALRRRDAPEQRRECAREDEPFGLAGHGRQLDAVTQRREDERASVGLDVGLGLGQEVQRVIGGRGPTDADDAAQQVGDRAVRPVLFVRRAADPTDPRAAHAWVSDQLVDEA